MAIQRRTCPLRGTQVILNARRAQIPLPWPQAPAGLPDWTHAPRIWEGEGIQVVANGVPLMVIEAQDPSEGLGANEVIVHGAAPLEGVLRAARMRARDLSGDPRLSHALWFWERGHARVPTPHSQLVVSPTPWPGRAWTWSALEEALAAGRAQGRCLNGVHLPWAPQVPFEAWICAEDIGVLAQRTQAWLARLDRALGVPLSLSWAPVASPSVLVVQPRLHPASGLQAAGGVFHHGVSSEVAAQLLEQSEPEHG